jgi:hypothetical protein
MTREFDPSPPYLYKEGKKENFFIKHWKHWKYGLVRCGNFAGICGNLREFLYPMVFLQEFPQGN